MIADGIGTCVASFFGSPFGTVIYIGHPVHKSSGAKVGYSLANGCIYLYVTRLSDLVENHPIHAQYLLCAAHLQDHVLVRSPRPDSVICQFGNDWTYRADGWTDGERRSVELYAKSSLPGLHYGFVPSVYDWVTNVADRAPLTDDGTFNTNTPGTPGWIGVLAWKRGALLVSMLWVAMLVQVIDRQWKLAVIWAILSSLFAVFGIIHVPTAGLKNFSDPFWEQCTADGCWEFAEQWMFFVAYLILAATFALIGLVSKVDDSIDDPIDDESRHAFDDWFKDANVDTSISRRTKAMSVQEANAVKKELEDDSAEEAEKEQEVANA